jgi:hypothetical protein
MARPPVRRRRPARPKCAIAERPSSPAARRSWRWQGFGTGRRGTGFAGGHARAWGRPARCAARWLGSGLACRARSFAGADRRLDGRGRGRRGGFGGCRGGRDRRYGLGRRLRGIDRRRVHQQRVVAADDLVATGLDGHPDDGVVDGPRTGDDELRAGGRALQRDAGESDLRYAVGFPRRGCEPEAIGGKLLAGRGQHLDDQPQRLSQRRLLEDATQAQRLHRRAGQRGGQREQGGKAAGDQQGNRVGAHRWRARGSARSALSRIVQQNACPASAPAAALR